MKDSSATETRRVSATSTLSKVLAGPETEGGTTWTNRPLVPLDLDGRISFALQTRRVLRLVMSSSTSVSSYADPPVPLDANAVVLTQEEKTEVASKLQTAREKKDVGDTAFKKGDLKDGAPLTTAHISQ